MDGLAFLYTPDEHTKKTLRELCVRDVVAILNYNPSDSWICRILVARVFGRRVVATYVNVFEYCCLEACACAAKSWQPSAKVCVFVYSS